MMPRTRESILAVVGRTWGWPVSRDIVGSVISGGNWRFTFLAGRPLRRGRGQTTSLRPDIWWQTAGGLAHLKVTNYDVTHVKRIDRVIFMLLVSIKLDKCDRLL